MQTITRSVTSVFAATTSTLGTSLIPQTGATGALFVVFMLALIAVTVLICGLLIRLALSATRHFKHGEQQRKKSPNY